MNDDPEFGTDGGGPEAVTGDEPREEADDGEAWDGADEPTTVPVDPGDPSAENVAFVVLGALLTLFVFARVAGLV